jgi:hypothetical protein
MLINAAGKPEVGPSKHVRRTTAFLVTVRLTFVSWSISPTTVSFDVLIRDRLRGGISVTTMHWKLDVNSLILQHLGYEENTPPMSLEAL